MASPPQRAGRYDPTPMSGPPSADAGGQAQWLTSLSGTPGAADGIVTLIFGVPETDNSAFAASCGPGSSSAAASVVFYVNADLPEGQQVNLFISNGQVGGRYSGIVANGMATGVTLDVDVNDPLWTVLEGSGNLDITVPGTPPLSLPLAGAAPQVQAFLSACAAQFAATGAPTGSSNAVPLPPLGNGAPMAPMGNAAPMAPAGPPPSDVGQTMLAPMPSEKYVTPSVSQLGKWVEGLAYDGQWLWAAESGQRTIAKVDPHTGQVAARVKVGRLPVSMASAGNGWTYALVETDKTVWRQPGNGNGSVLAHLAGCPQDMTLAGGTPWVLVMPDCSSAQSQVVRVDPGSGQQATSPLLGEWGQAMTAVGGQIWVAHARGPAISVTEQATMRTNWVDARGASLWSLTANSTAVYAGGRIEENNDAGLVVMFDPQRQIEMRRATVSERVAEIASNDQHVVAVGAKGTIWVLSAQDLSLEQTITLTTGAFEPKAALLLGNTLLVTAGTYQGNSGAILIVDNVFP